MSTTATVTDKKEPTQEQTDFLKVSDRCDRCGAQGFIYAINEDHDLILCGHHGNKYKDALMLQGFIVHDERYKLNEKPSISANAE